MGTLGTDQPVRSTGSKLAHATTLWDYINRAMPFNAPQTLTADEVYALTAYVLHLNDILPLDAVLDRESLPKLKLPNRDGFTTAHGFMRARRQARYAQHRLHARLREGSAPVLGNARLRARPARQPGGADAQSRGRRVAASARSRRRRSGLDLAKAAACTACHGVNERIVGPGFREIATKYAGDAKARIPPRRQGQGGRRGRLGHDSDAGAGAADGRGGTIARAVDPGGREVAIVEVWRRASMSGTLEFDSH